MLGIEGALVVHRVSVAVKLRGVVEWRQEQELERLLAQRVPQVELHCRLIRVGVEAVRASAWGSETQKSVRVTFPNVRLVLVLHHDPSCLVRRLFLVRSGLVPVLVLD